MASLSDPQFQAFLAAEKAQESGGNYGAVSPAGAVGAYQVLPSNIAAWSRQILGYSISEQEFLQNHALQDTIVAGILLDYVNKYGYQGAAAMWFSGQPNPNSQASDGGTTVQNYVASVMARMGQAGPQDTGFTPASNALPAAQPQLSLDALRQTAPLVAVLVTSVPEINGIFQQAVSGQWSTDKFISAVQNSHWWATHSDAARQALLLQNTDPATWNRQVTQLEASLNEMAAQLGALPTNSQLYALAVDALTNGYDQNQAVLRQKFAQYVNPVSGLHFGGEAGSDETQLRQDMMNLGVFLPEKQLDQNLRNIVGGTTDVNSIEAQLRTQAAATYPAYAKEINSGMNVSDIADPYMQQAMQLLEKGPGEINIMNPLIKGALQNTQNGVPAPLSLTDFETRVRQQPDWLHTQNAQDSMMQTAHKILQDFGFAY